ncbi:F-box protein At3g08750-like [Solanum tuberosum]|uniref:Ubiquitin-protein ligase n=1 Tax=Solanum tuberosum TaxID=4113 RepID=M1DA17_SOLTU|nr:PREDICTED: F-box protein At3g08750-like [Solanum tuberosum]
MDSVFVSNPRNNYSVPHDIIIDILTQLPVKSLIRFKGVCKSWYSLIKDDNFIKQHYDTHQNCQKYFVVCRRHKISTHYTMELDSNSIASLVAPPVPIDQSRKAFNEIQYCSCNGILLITYANDIIIMWNPATRESRRIPKCKSGGLYNFCYFPRIESYKIFRLGPVVFNGDKDEMDIDIFSTKSNKWKTVGIFPPDYYFEGTSIVMSDGIVYMMAERKENENCTILRFCLDKEEFQEELLFPNTIPSEIHVVGEKLCLIGSLMSNHKIHEFWLYMMKTNSWNKILAIRLPSKSCLKPLSFIKDGGIMFKNYMSKYVFKAYNSTTHKLEKVNVAGLEGHNFKEVVTYVETLSSPFL